MLPNTRNSATVVQQQATQAAQQALGAYDCACANIHPTVHAITCTHLHALPKCADATTRGCPASSHKSATCSPAGTVADSLVQQHAASILVTAPRSKLLAGLRRPFEGIRRGVQLGRHTASCTAAHHNHGTSRPHAHKRAIGDHAARQSLQLAALKVATTVPSAGTATSHKVLPPTFNNHNPQAHLSYTLAATHASHQQHGKKHSEAHPSGTPIGTVESSMHLPVAQQIACQPQQQLPRPRPPPPYPAASAPTDCNPPPPPHIHTAA
jgi:hypothetical protein